MSLSEIKSLKYFYYVAETGFQHACLISVLNIFIKRNLNFFILQFFVRLLNVLPDNRGQYLDGTAYKSKNSLAINKRKPGNHFRDINLTLQTTE